MTGLSSSTIPPLSLPGLISPLCALAVEAGAVIMTHYKTETEVAEKEDRTPVTVADRESDHKITTGLAALTPDIPVVSEESAPVLETNPRRFFLVDPLDGTKEFINQTPEFTVNIALIDNHRPVLGVIYAPAMATLFFTGDGQAFMQEIPPGGMAAQASRAAQAAQAARRITARPAPPDGLVALVSRSHRGPETDAYLHRYPVRAFESIGSSLKFCLIASGAADIYPRHGPTMAWDTAAGHAILTAAGGSVTTLDGAPLLYAKERGVLKNPPFVARGRT